MTEKKLAMGIKTINQISVSLASAKTADIGMGSGATATSLDATDLSITAHAWDAMQVIDKAIDDVSALRGTSARTGTGFPLRRPTWRRRWKTSRPQTP